MSWGLKFFSEEDFETIDQVRNEIPDATEIKECEGGWIAFEYADNAETWENQN